MRITAVALSTLTAALLLAGCDPDTPGPTVTTAPATTSAQATTTATAAAAVTVPAVTGERPVKALQILKASGLKGEFKSANPGAVAGSIPNRGPGDAECEVDTADPAVGAMVAPGTVVTMTSSTIGTLAHPGQSC